MEICLSVRSLEMLAIEDSFIVKIAMQEIVRLCSDLSPNFNKKETNLTALLLT